MLSPLPAGMTTEGALPPPRNVERIISAEAKRNLRYPGQNQLQTVPPRQRSLSRPQFQRVDWRHLAQHTASPAVDGLYEAAKSLSHESRGLSGRRNGRYIAFRRLGGIAWIVKHGGGSWT